MTSKLELLHEGQAIDHGKMASHCYQAEVVSLLVFKQDDPVLM